MAKKIEFTLSKKSIENAIKELKKYKQELIDKNKLFVKQLAEAGIPVIDERMNQAAFTIDEKGIQSGSNTEHSTRIVITNAGGISKADLIVEGEEIIFIEFGAGVYYNSTEKHPKAGDFGYRIGYYGKGHGKQKVWGYYNEKGDLVLTHGVNATLPVYTAGIEIRDKVIEIAKEVFGS